MSFMDSYKRLDNLCKTFAEYPKGISSYIEEMEKSNQVRYQSVGWSSDYSRLKEYRHIRNQIAHDNGIYEDEMCDVGDEEWLKDFHARILDQTDPLAQYFKAQRTYVQQSKKVSPMPSEPNITYSAKKQRNPIGCAACIALIGVAVLVIIALIILL